MAYLLGIDLGTTGLKAGIYDLEGRLCGLGYQDYDFITPQPGWAEHDPNIWWQACCHSVQTALDQAGLSGRDVAAVGVCGVHHMPVFLAEDGKVVRNTPTTHDTRVEESLEQLRADGVLDEIITTTGSMVCTAHFPPPFHWVREHDPDSLRQTRHILLPKDFIRLRLTGKILTELCDATGTHLVDPKTEQWSPRLCELLGVPQAILPEIRRATDVVGEITPEAAVATGLSPGTPVVAGGGDTHCCLLGMGVMHSAMIGMLLGTSGTLRGAFSGYVEHPRHLVYTQRHVVPGMWTASASTLAGSASLRWFRQMFVQEGPDEDRTYEEMLALAAEVPPGSDGLMFHPFLYGERSPYYNSRIRALFFGITAWQSKGHFIRSVLEGVGYSLRNCLRLLEEVAESCGEQVGEIRLAGGGAKNALYRQIMADVLNRALHFSTHEQVGALGACMLAGIGTGLYPDCETAVQACVRVAQVIEPNKAMKPIYDQGFARFNEVFARLEDYYR